MSYNTKNYTEQGGDVTHFGGKVIFEDGCEVEGNTFTPAANQAASTAVPSAKGIVPVSSSSGTVP